MVSHAPYLSIEHNSASGNAYGHIPSKTTLRTLDSDCGSLYVGAFDVAGDPWGVSGR